MSIEAPRRLDEPIQPDHGVRRASRVLALAVKKFVKIDGSQSAAAFAHNAFFSLFPLIVVLVAIASVFVDRDLAGRKVVAYVEAYVPLDGGMRRHVFDTISGVIEARQQAGGFAALMLVWTATQFLTTLISATNRAWGAEAYNWWRLPLKSLALLATLLGAALLGGGLPMLATVAKDWLLPAREFGPWVYALGRFVIPVLVAFLSLSLFYRMAPSRPTRMDQVWVGALCATFLLQVGATLFLIYLQRFATLNAVYGALGGIMALLLWVYLSGCIFIFGACLCAAQAEARSMPLGRAVALNQGTIEA